MGEIEEALKFDPGFDVQTTEEAEQDEIERALKFDPGPVGGTMQPKKPPFPGATSPVSVFTGRPETEFVPGSEPDASFKTMMKTGLVNDPLTRVKIYAEGRGISIADIAKRYRFGKDGQVEFKADDGQWQREVSEVPLKKGMQMGAQVLSHPSTYLGTIGAIGAGPKGAVVGAMAGEAVRKSLGKQIYDEPQTAWGNIFDVGLEGLLALGGEMVGRLIIGQINKLRMRKSKSLRFAGKEITEGLLTPADHAKALYIETLASKHGVTLAPHQLYDKEGMTNIWMYLRKHPLTSDAVQKFDKTLESQTDEAIDGFIKQMGGYEETPFSLGKRLKDASADAIEELESARATTVKPYYDKAFDRVPEIDTAALVKEMELNRASMARADTSDIPDVKKMLGELKGQPDVPPTIKIKGEDETSYMARIAKDYKRIMGKEAPVTKSDLAAANIKGFEKRNLEIEKVLKSGKPVEGVYAPTKVISVDISDATAEIDRLMAETVPDDPSYKALALIKKMIKTAKGDARKLDRVKRSGIDNILTKTKTDRTMAREMRLVKKQLTDAMDAQIPDYSAARGIYGEFGMAPPIEEMKNSVIGQLANLEGDTAISKAVHKIFNVKNMPDYIKMREARKVIMAQDPELWNRAIGGYIRDIYFYLTVTEGGSIVNSAGKMNKLLFGNKPRRLAMAEAFGGSNTEGFKNFEGLMQVLQRAAIGRSQQSMTAPFQQIQKELTGEMGSTARRALDRPKDFLVEKALGWWDDALLRGRQGALMEALMDPKVRAQIAKLKPLKPRSKRYIEGLTTLGALIAPKLEPKSEVGFEIPETLPPTGTPLSMEDKQPPGHPGKELLGYLKKNVMGREPEGKWLADSRVSGKEQPGIYAEPNLNWEEGVLAGAKAKLAPISMLQKAMKMAKSKPIAAGKNKIWKDTGWMQGPEGKWRFEIDDFKAKFKNLKPDTFGNVDKNTYLSDILKHDDLYKNYPEIENMMVKIMIDKNMTAPRASFTSRIDRSAEGLFDLEPEIKVIARNVKEAKESLLHEIQHVIQGYEDFLKGSTPGREMEGTQLKALYESFADEFNKLQKKGFDQRTGFESSRYLKLRDDIIPRMARELRTEAFNKYINRPGEVEANEVIKRLGMTSMAKKEQAPWLSQ